MKFSLERGIVQFEKRLYEEKKTTTLNRSIQLELDLGNEVELFIDFILCI